MEQDLIAKGIISAVFHWPERSKNWYYVHGGRLNPDDGTLEFPPTLREKALELMKKIEDVKAGRLKVDKEMDELTMALGNLEHPRRCRGYGVVLWKYAFKGNLDSYKSRKRRKEHEEEHWHQMMGQRLKEQEEKMQVEIERGLELEHCPKYLWIPSLSLPLGKAVVLVLRLAPGACIEVTPGACTEGPEEMRAIEGVPVDDNQQCPMDFLCRCTPCELHKPFGNITMHVAYGSAFAHFPRQTSHNMLIPPGYASVSLEEICQPQFEDLELDIPGGDGERTLKDAVHNIILWPKHYIITPPPQKWINPSYRSPAATTIVIS
jgi:hypothetical protein